MRYLACGMGFRRFRAGGRSSLVRESDWGPSGNVGFATGIQEAAPNLLESLLNDLVGLNAPVTTAARLGHANSPRTGWTWVLSAHGPSIRPRQKWCPRRFSALGVRPPSGEMGAESADGSNCADESNFPQVETCARVPSHHYDRQASDRRSILQRFARFAPVSSVQTDRLTSSAHHHAHFTPARSRASAVQPRKDTSWK